jgi:hypothetical protein
MKALIVRFALVMLLGALPNFGNVAPASAASVCYYYNYSDTHDSYFYAGHAYYYSTTDYKVGYDCYGAPVNIEVTHLYEYYWVDRNPTGSSLGHYWGTTQITTPSQGILWRDGYQPTCYTNGTNSCSMAKEEWPNYWLNYDYNARIYTSILSCNPIPQATSCAMSHYFLQRWLNVQPG